MGFKQYLIERHVNGKYNIAFHKLLSALDSAHIEASDDKYEFNLGSVIKDSVYNNLMVRISKGSEEFVKFGNAGEKYFIVISTKRLPTRMKIDTFISSKEEVKNKFIEYLADYAANHVDHDNIEKNKYELTDELHDKGSYEEKYDALITAIQKTFTEYSKTVDDLDGRATRTANDLKKSSIGIAKDNLKKEYFGTNDQEFIKIAMKLPEADFINLLDKETKDKTLKRLASFYDQKV